MTQHVLIVHGTKTYLNGQECLIKGLRCSNALISDATTEQLIDHLDVFASYGVNAISVYFMGSRFGDVQGYLESGELGPGHAERMGRIIQAADQRAMVVLVGCLYWGNTRAKWESWSQREAELAVSNTVAWLSANGYRNTLLDVDNEGMALRAKGFDNRALVQAAKATDPSILVGTNYRGAPPPEADLALHHSDPAPHKPYIESEGSPPSGMPVEGGYWGAYSKLEGLYAYRNVGLYTEAMKASQIEATRSHLDQGQGYMLASTWLQAPLPQGPNQRPGGHGGPRDPGIKWWLEFLQNAYGAYNTKA